jgi:hypothetical protein
MTSRERVGLTLLLSCGRVPEQELLEWHVIRLQSVRQLKLNLRGGCDRTDREIFRNYDIKFVVVVKTNRIPIYTFQGLGKYILSESNSLKKYPFFWTIVRNFKHRISYELLH